MTRVPHSVLISSSLQSVATHARQSELDQNRRDIKMLMQDSYDYTKGKLGELIDIIIDSGAKLFGKISFCSNQTLCLTPKIVSAVGVPPREVVDKLHKHGILYAVSCGDP